jgi:hypothetical protein
MKTNMRSNLIQTCLLAVAFLALPSVARAQFDFTTNNGAITITGYAGSGGDVTISNSINGLPVTSIADGAFQDCASLTSVTIPDSVTNIGNYGFSGSSLKSVIIGNGVTTIGNYAFSLCERLANIMMGNSVTSIREEAFNSTAFASVTIPDSVTSIGYGAFDNARLTSVTIPDSVTNIGSLAFSQSGLSSITIPNSVTSIEDGAFWLCGSLTAISVAVENPFYSSLNGVLFDKSQTTLIVYPNGLTGNYTIPSSITVIGDGAFEGCGLTSVTIPNSVTNIGDSAFSGCAGLTNVTIGNSVANIGNYAFDNCYNITSVTIPDSVTNLGDSAFNGCDLTNVTLGSGVTTIGDDAFTYCVNLTSVYFLGNAPAADSSVFANVRDIYGVGLRTNYYATAYYLPGTTS